MNVALRMNRHQKEFLKKMRQHPTGLPTTDWPSPIALRRWMRHAGFKRAIDSIRAAMQVQADLHLISAAAQASTGLAGLLSAGAAADNKAQITSLVQLIRVAHWRLKELRQADAQHELIEMKRPPIRHIVHPAHGTDPASVRRALQKLKDARAEWDGKPYVPEPNKPVSWR